MRPKGRSDKEKLQDLRESMKKAQMKNEEDAKA